MKNIYFTVGPSHAYPTLKKHLKSAIAEEVPSMNHRGAPFEKLYAQAKKVLKELMNIPDTHHIFFLSSSHESMERIIRGTIDQHSFHFVTGAFSKIFYNYALDYGKKPEKAEDLTGKGFDMENIKISEQTEVICVTQNETSTGISIPMEDIYLLKKRYPSRLIAMDVVSSAPYVDIDFSKIDMTFFSVQKCFGLPAGLSVLIVNEKALKKAKALGEKHSSKGGHHGILTLYKDSLRGQTTETPNVLNIYLLEKVTEDLLKKGIEKIRKETEQKADLLYKFFDNHPVYRPLLSGKYRSKTVIVVDMKGKTRQVLSKLAKKGFIVGPGYGDKKDTEMRIANFPATTVEQVKSLIEAIRI